MRDQVAPLTLALLLASGWAMADPRWPSRPKKEAAETEGLKPIIGGTVTQAKPADRGFELGLRFGAALPVGHATADTALSDVIQVAFPLEIDLGYRVVPNWSVGMYIAYGVASNASDACSVLDCGASRIDLGIAVEYHFMPRGKVDPWVSLGTGYQWLNLWGSGPGVELSETAHGFEFIRAQLGMDAVLHKRGAPFGGAGLFAAGSVGQYMQSSTECSGAICPLGSSSGAISDKAIHAWILVGGRGTFVL